ncbi:hypothetical protein E2K80_16985 [Rhodophyticola sp. CCM32]|uniref:hypothetical protein n=1 Tax=Rhodophyticola sp. CCM32 TaxID=2916397 RepID=UPI00107F586A|nr:hypothetical protein [Rhodophyticola sp. CCM32]QBY02224.1 hypothetical protein E2K80_16985 [Rhodophyticola sp. CCM32]
MTRVGAVLGALLLWAGLAWGQVAAVQSGDHEGFTRLVLPIGAERTWQLERRENIGQLSFSPDLPPLDVSGVFDRIDRARLTEIATDTGLTLTLGCNCGLSLYRFRDDYLVIDITDPAPAGPETGPDGPRTTSMHGQLPPLPNPFTIPQIVFDLPEDRPVIPPPALAPDPRLDEAAALLTEQLARASAAGLLEAAPLQPLSAADPRPAQQAQPAPVDTPATTDPDISDHAQSGHIPMARMHDPGPGLRAETAFDALHHGREGPVPVQTPLSCPPGTDLDISTWASGAGFEQEIGWLRARLYDDRDRVVPAAALALAKYYIYYGFGAEALFWLNQLADAPPALLAMAGFLTDTGHPVFSAIDTTIGCNGTEILWRYLDAPGDRPLSDEETRIILRAFARHPHGLRDLMGPGLVRRFLDENRMAAAQDVRDALARGNRLTDTAQFLVDMEMDHNATTAAMETGLEQVMRSDTGNAPEAMRRYLALHRQEGARVSAERLTAADALLRETGAGPALNSLWSEILLAHAATGNLDRALDLAAMTTDPDITQAMITELFAHQAGQQDLTGLVLLTTARADQWQQTRGTQALRSNIAERFLTEGLPDLAFRLAPPGLPMDAPPEDAMATPADHALALAWRHGDWPALSAMPAGPHAEFATLAVTLPDNPSPPRGPLICRRYVRRFPTAVKPALWSR